MRAGAGSLEGTAAVIVRPATIERFGDIEPVINRACWCQYWRQTAAEYGPSTYSIDHSNWDRRREALRAQCAVEPVPGVIAYLGDLPVGWCGFGPRSSMKRLEGSRTIPKIDDVAVWSIVCFDVRRGYKRRGVATALLGGRSSLRGAMARVASRLTQRIRQVPVAAPARHTWGSRACSRRPVSAASSRPPASPSICPDG